MPVYLKAKSIPELASLDPPIRNRVYKHALRRAQQEGKLKWPILWGLLGCVALAVLMVMFEGVLVGENPAVGPMRRLLWRMSHPQWWGAIVIYAVPFAIWFSHTLHSRLRPYIREYLTTGT